MKIRTVVADGRKRVYGLFRKGLPYLKRELFVLQQLHRNKREMHEWVCIHSNKDIAYIGFSNAYKDGEICGLHLLFLFVKPEFQGRGIGSELMQFALRQKVVKGQDLFTTGNSAFFSRFGFSHCHSPESPLSSRKKVFLSLQKNESPHYIIGYEPEVL